MAGTSDTPEDSPPSPDDINSRLAEIAAELASEARFKEPSAAERASARVAATRPAAQPVKDGPLRWWRARHKAAELRRPVHLRGHAPAAPRPARQAKGPSRLARRAANRRVPDRGYADGSGPSALRSGAAIVIILALLAGAVIGLRYAFRHRSSPGSAVPPAASPATHRATTPPTSAASAASAFDPAAPFSGTPAVDYANGPEGIVVPADRTYGTFSAVQVSAAFATVRKLLIAGYLDPQALSGGRPTAFARLLDTQERSFFLRNLSKTGLAKNGAELSTRAWITSFAPGTTQLVGTVIKVHGSMSAGAARYAGRSALQIRADYVFVYPVSKPGDAASGVRIVSRLVLTVYFGPWNEPASSALVPHISTILGGPAGALCEPSDGYIHPAFPGGPTEKQTTNGTTVNPYDQSMPPSVTAGCIPITGT